MVIMNSMKTQDTMKLIVFVQVDLPGDMLMIMITCQTILNNIERGCTRVLKLDNSVEN